MPIIKPKTKPEKGQVRISIENHILEKVTQYCEWVGIKKVDDFFEQAAEHILLKDKAWLNHINQKTPA